MKITLTGKILHGFIWMSVSKVGNIILHLVILAILARLLAPSEFGMLAAAMVFVNFSDIFVQLGVGPSIIIKKDIDNSYIRTAFTLSIVFGFSIGLLVLCLAPFLSGVFKIKELANILAALSILFPIKSLSVVAESLLKKNMRFKVLAFRGLISYAVGYGAVGITLALFDFGVWALVLANISQVIINTIFVLIAHPHKKIPLIRRELVKEILFYGGGFTLSRIFSYTANQADNFIVARWLGASALGFYNKAYTLMKTPINLYGQMLHDVLFPALSSVRDKSSQMTSVFSKGTMILSVLSLPIMLLMIALAPEIILLFLGNQWVSAIEPFQIIAFGMYFRVGYRISNIIAKSAGVIYKNAYLQMIFTVLIIVAAFIGKKWGINGVAAGVTLAIFIQFLLMSGLGLSITTITWKKFLKLHFPALGFSIILLPFILIVTYFSRINNFPEILVLLTNLVVVVIITSILIRLKLYNYLGKEFVSVFNLLIELIKNKYATTLKR